MPLRGTSQTCIVEVRLPPPTKVGGFRRRKFMKYEIQIQNLTGQVVLTKSLTKERYTIGRAPDNDVWLPDASLDLYHAELQIRQHALFVVDLNSENSTLKNGYIVPPGKDGVVVENGDKILIGEHVILVTAQEMDSQRLKSLEEAASLGQQNTLSSTIAIGSENMDHDLYKGIVAIKKFHPRVVYLLNEPKRYEIEKTKISVGRDESNEIVLNHPSISKIHSEIYLRDGQFYVKDKNSTNGTYVNEVKVPESRIDNQSYIRFGGVQALFVTDYSLDEAVGHVQTMSREEMISRLRSLKKISASQAAAIKDDVEMKNYDVPESALMKGYFTPAEWMPLFRQLKSMESSPIAQKRTNWLLFLILGINLFFILLLGLFFVLFVMKK